MNEGMRYVSHLVCALGAFVFLAALFTPLVHAEFDEYNFDTPENVGDLVFNFFHHSCGADLLDNGLRSGLEGLGYRHARPSHQAMSRERLTRPLLKPLPWTNLR